MSLLLEQGTPALESPGNKHGITHKYWIRKGVLPWHVPEKFTRFGLYDIEGRTFLSEAQTPLSEEMRQAITLLIDMRWPGAEGELSDEDRALFQRLCQPQSPDFILDIPGYYAFFTETLFYGRIIK